MQTKIIEIQSEIGAGTRGASLGIEALKAVSRVNNDGLFSQFKLLSIATENDALFKAPLYPRARYIEHYQVLFERIIQEVSPQVSDKPLLFLTGDHSNAAPILSTILNKNPTRKLGVIWIDAHADLHSPFTSPSGNIHGMPLYLVSHYNNETNYSKQASPDCLAIWKKLRAFTKNTPTPKVAFIGLRDVEKEEQAIIDNYELPVILVADLIKNGVKDEMAKLKDFFADCDDIYISFDVDSLDVSVSNGTGTPVEHGLSLDQAKEVTQALFDELRQVKYFEITEINPLLDTEGNSMAKAAYEIMQIALSNLG